MSQFISTAIQVSDASSHRDLLNSPAPVVLDAGSSASAVTLSVTNTADRPVNVELRCEQPWLRLGNSQLHLDSGQSAPLSITIGSVIQEEFALLELQWSIDEERFAETVLFQRLETKPPQPPAPKKEIPAPKIVPPADTSTGLPDWLS